MSGDKPTLDYEPPSPIAVSAPRMVWQCFLGFFAAIFVLTFTEALAIGILMSIEADAGRTAATVAGITLALAVLSALAFLAIRYQRRPDQRGLGIGIWLGLGVFMLLAGLCFGVL